MGQQANPVGLRLGLRESDSRWCIPGRGFADAVCQDIRAREYLHKALKQAAVSKIIIERPTKSAKVVIHAARPGVIIGKKGEFVENIKNELSKILGVKTHVSIEEVRKPDLDARLVAEAVAGQLERRVMFRRAMKRAMSSSMRAGAKGIKIKVSGRVGGAEIARSEWYHEGQVPLHTLKADIDYAIAEAHTTYGVIGVKVWIHRGEIAQHRALKDKE